MPCNKFYEICMDSIVEAKRKPYVSDHPICFKNINTLVAFLKG